MGRFFYAMIVGMDLVIIYTALVLFGACLGSFAGAQVWRIRAKQLQADKAAKEPYDHKEYARLKKLLGKKTAEDRSRCLECGHELQWIDLIPIVSWVALRGRCRKCKHPIGKFELFMELGVAAFFVLSFMFWPGELQTPLEITHFVLWLIAGVIMAVLFAYDLKWFLLPDSYSLALAGVGAAIVGITAVQAQDVGGTLLTALGGVAILSGLYAALYVLSRGRLIGFGDIKLGVGLALILVEWQLAAIALFLANFIGCLIVIPLLASKKLKRNSQVPFGPLLIAGAVLAWFLGWRLLDWYLSTLAF